MYVDYDFYKLDWNGKAPEEDFAQLNIKATQLINYYTFDKIKELENIEDNIKYATCELIDEMYRLQATDEKEVASEKVGTYSITYAVSDSDVRKKQKDIIKKWLGHTGLLFRGV